MVSTNNNNNKFQCNSWKQSNFIKWCYLCSSGRDSPRRSDLDRLLSMTRFKKRMKQSIPSFFAGVSKSLKGKLCLHDLNGFDDAIERLYNSSWSSTHLRRGRRSFFRLELNWNKGSIENLKTCKLTDPLTDKRIAWWEIELGDFITIFPSTGSWVKLKAWAFQNFFFIVEIVNVIRKRRNTYWRAIDTIWTRKLDGHRRRRRHWITELSCFHQEEADRFCGYFNGEIIKDGKKFSLW